MNAHDSDSFRAYVLEHHAATAAAAAGPHTLFTASDYAALANIVFRPDYPGNATARGVVEAPNGDPTARDVSKRYAHVAVKYLDQAVQEGKLDPALYHTLCHYLDRAWERAMQVAHALGVPHQFLPSFEFGCLRVLEYPPGTGSHVHTDFDLFTLMAYRNQPSLLQRNGWTADLNRLDAIDRGLHLGELGDLLGLGHATRHRVAPAADIAQHSIVYFAIPDHAAVLPNGTTVGTWIAERLARSRYDREGGSSR